MHFALLLFSDSLAHSEEIVSRWPNSRFFKSVNVLNKKEIRLRILKETPGLLDALIRRDDILILRLIRNWAANTIDLNSGGTSYWMNLDSEDRTIMNMLYLFDHNLLGVHCGDASQFLGMVYKLFGYSETYAYNSGVYFQDEHLQMFNEGKTHVITLVKAKFGGREYFIAEDVLFDSEYRLSNEKVSDFGKLLRRLKANPSSPVERMYNQRPFKRETLSVLKEKLASTKNFEELFRSIKVETRPDIYQFSWEKWIKPKSKSAKLLRKVLNFEGRVFPYHLFLFPIGGNWDFLGIKGLKPFEEHYKVDFEGHSID